MGLLFDLDFVTTHFGTCNLSHFLSLIQAASQSELRQFRRLVKRHRKHHPQQPTFSNTPSLTTHGAIIAAIDHELLKRSPWFKLWSFTLPVRQFLVAKFSGLELQRSEHFGAVDAVPQYRKSVWHMPHKEIGSVLWRFIVAYQKAMVGAILTVVSALVVKWLTSS